MAAPLCPGLYRALAERFGRVIIANEGEPCVERVETDKQGRVRGCVTHSGEEYRVNCLKCSDTKFRLYIGHRFAEHRHLAHCFNENCYADPAARMQLYMRIFRTRRPVSLPVGAARALAAVAAPELPGRIIPLTDLPAGHRALTYLTGRGFDPAELTDLYGVGYCDEAHPRFPLAEGRIVAPVLSEGKLAGWQARYVGDPDWKSCPVPKYYTMKGMRVGLSLYNLDRAATHPFAVLVEGVTDVWAVGPNAVALFGKSISFGQRKLIERVLRHRPLVVMLDGDAQAENDAATQDLAGVLTAGVVRVTLPAGRDPANFSRLEIAELIRRAAEQSGVQLPTSA